MNLKERARIAAKTARNSQPFNYVATSITRALLRATGLQPEFIVKHLHRTGVTRSRLPNGRRLRLWSRGGDDWVSNQVFWRGWNGYEAETVLLFYHLARRAKVTFDIGAYVGYYTLLAAHANPGARVFAFEPMPEIFKRLRRNVALNQLRNVQCVHSAVGETAGSADFYHIGIALPTSSSLSYHFMEGTPDLHHSVVPVIALDRFTQDNGIEKIDLMEIDTESTEPDVLRGMMETLRRDHPTIVCEVLHGRGSNQPLEEILAPLGYRYYLLTPQGPVLQEKIEGHPQWFNYLFTVHDLNQAGS